MNVALYCILQGQRVIKYSIFLDYTDTLKGVPSWCILLTVLSLSQIMTHICQFQKAVVHKMPRSLTSVHQEAFIPVSRRTMQVNAYLRGSCESINCILDGRCASIHNSPNIFKGG